MPSHHPFHLTLVCLWWGVSPSGAYYLVGGNNCFGLGETTENEVIFEFFYSDSALADIIGK